MGVGDGDAIADDDGRSNVCETLCSICLEGVIDDGSRSCAKLLCGHQFHLDCIGSAFNVKGAMQCPNCRKVEKGQWLYANGSRTLPDFVMDDWTRDEDTFDFSYAEMSFGVHWCPFSGLTRLPSYFDEVEFPSITYRDHVGYHDAYAELTPVSSTNNPRPYNTYLGPIHPSSSVSNHGSVSDGSTYISPWTGPALPNEAYGAYAFPSADIHYHSWDHSSPFGTTAYSTGGPRTARNSSDIARPAIQPFILGHSYASRAPSSITPSMVPPTPYSAAVARPHHEHAPLQANFQQSTANPQVARVPSIINYGRRSSTSHRGALAHVAPLVATSSTEQQNSGGFYFFSAARTFQEAERAHHDHYHYWERERDSSSSSIWGPLYPANGVGSYGSHAWHGSSQNQS